LWRCQLINYKPRRSSMMSILSLILFLNWTKTKDHKDLHRRQNQPILKNQVKSRTLKFLTIWNQSKNFINWQRKTEKFTKTMQTLNLCRTVLIWKWRLCQHFVARKTSKWKSRWCQVSYKTRPKWTYLENQMLHQFPRVSQQG
jgi:hypothetical protein